MRIRDEPSLNISYQIRYQKILKRKERKLLKNVLLF